MPISTSGINHPALIARNIDQTVQFYTEVLGMKLVLSQPNLDEPRMTHLFFSAGNGGFLAFFTPNEGSGLEIPQATQGITSMLHVALNLDVSIEEAMDTLRNYNVPFSGPIDRGYERSLYFKDPNGIVVELLSWITPLPEGADEAEVIAKAQVLREAEGAYNIEDVHVRNAMVELGFRLDD